MQDIGKHSGDLIILFMCFNISEKSNLYIYEIIYIPKIYSYGSSIYIFLNTTV
jgi:hypothetical protein